MQLNELKKDELVIVCRLYGALYYYPPNDFEKVQLNTYFQHDVETPIYDINVVLNAFKIADKTKLKNEFSRLFSSSIPFSVPPWSSIYLDQDSNLNGPSTKKYCDFIEHCGLKLREGFTDPEDHLGLMLMVLAMLIDDDQEQHISELLGEYILPWFPFFANRIKAEARQESYVKLTKGTEDLLNHLRVKYNARTLAKTNYFPVD
ncbi:TorD/DmsD family molecular chaperone [Vibrio salinus]|uniref:TorD/DmsD family molecular chaperone n=1 Tax=Vibrio salinus TaxID=2899784 RepID=UPI001E41ADFB|nr:molecular chaperone TorD family protein [Vibrio salinus]MCE0495304.1 molecular chaperone TorD family protein [Vibrio salinus]